MFDTRIKFKDEGDAHGPIDSLKADGDLQDSSDDPADEETSDGMDWGDEQATLVDSNSDLDHDGEADANTDGDNDIDSDSDTDDDIDAGHDRTGTLLWRHITFIIAPHESPGEPNVLFAKVTIVHTKGEDNCPREYGMP